MAAKISAKIRICLYIISRFSHPRFKLHERDFKKNHLKIVRNSKAQKKIKKDQDFNIFNNSSDETVYDSE